MFRTVLRSLRGEASEDRSASVDVGSLYSQFFAFGASSYNWSISPAVLAATLSVPDGAGAIVTESRRLCRISPLLIAYQRCMEGGVLAGEPEPPIFADSVPEGVAAAAAAVWTHAHDCERERDLLQRVMVDGELLILDGGQVIPADGFEPMMSGPDWNREVVGYKVGRSSAVRLASDCLYLGDRRMGDMRALPWVGPALPFAAALLTIRVSAGHGLAALAKIAAVIANTSPDRIVAGVGARTGVVSPDQPDNAAGREPITSTRFGSVPFLKPGEAVARIAAGPDETARKYEAELAADVACALNLPLSELRSDYSSGSFSNLRMGWTDAAREYARRRLWWHRAYRLPMWRAILSNAFANGDLGRMSRDVLTALRNPTWAGPRREPPQPEKQAQALALLTDKGIYTAAQALEKLEG